MMMICAKCKKEMRVSKTGRFVRYGVGHTYSGDEWSCDNCGALVVNCPSKPFHDTKSEAIQMEEPC